MAIRRTVVHYVMDIHRATGGQFHLGLVQQALADALKKIDQQGNYAFLSATALINTEAPYSTGTVTVSGGGTAVTGNSTSWDPFWVHREIKFGARQLPYPVTVIGGVGALTLGQALSGDTAITAGPYTLYRSRYYLPEDCEPGRDIRLRAGVAHGRRGRIPKLSRADHEARSSDQRGAGNILWYTDGDMDVTFNRPTIRLWPYPASAFELRVLYYRKLTVPASLDDYIELPESFELLPIKLATAELKKRGGLQGWQMDEAEAGNMMRDLYNRHGLSAAYENMMDPDDNYGEDQGGLYGESDALYTFGNY